MTECKTAKKLIYKWRDAVQKASMQNWQAIMFGKREIDKHRKTCKKCKGAKS